MIWRTIILGALLAASPALAQVGVVGEESVQAGGGGSVIDNVTFYAVVKSDDAADDVRFRINAVTGATDIANIGTSYAQISFVATVNPADSAAWEESDIAGIVAGLTTRNIAGTVRCTQLWFVVNRTGAADTTHRPNADHPGNDGSWLGNVSGTTISADIDEAISDDDTTYISTSVDFDPFMVAFEDTGS